MAMKSSDVRTSFLQYFEERDHRLVPSAPLVPHGDPTLLFTNAGMVQFKDYFLGVSAPPSPRAVTSQKCLRVSGKHNDLENVGPSARHHTFFEMLGNFSFGDYFKEEAIRFGWELVTEVWGLDPNHLSATVFEEDDEAAELWRQLSSLPPERIRRCGAADNFWAMGDTGPCGPCSEIFIDRQPETPEVDWEEGTESGRYLEIWNLVFMQFERAKDGSQKPLPKPSVDTGAGLERVAAVLQGVDSNYDTDLFQPIIAEAAELASVRYGAAVESDVSLRVIADHLRAVGFLLADGVIPSNEGRGYVLRRILRRAVRHGMMLGLEEPFLHRLVPTLGGIFVEAYPELRATESASRATVEAEEEKFLATLATGTRQIQEAIAAFGEGEARVLDGGTVFRLYDTYGLPLETIREVAEEERFTVDEEGFDRELESQRRRSRADLGAAKHDLAAIYSALAGDGELPATEFDGYRQLQMPAARILGLGRDHGEGADRTERLAAGESGVALLDRTVLYAESGGQVADQGSVRWAGGSARVTDVQKDGGGHFFHFLTIDEGELAVGDEVALGVPEEVRRATEKNHTATHLLHAALRELLGDGVRQAGSLVAPDRLRFDFTHGHALESEDLEAIEARVNHWVQEAVPVGIENRSYGDAIAAGAMALFGEKYGDRVRTVEVPGFSLELCGGCHVRNTGEIGLFSLTAERGIASGVRRIEAVGGAAALELDRERRRRLADVALELGVSEERAPLEIGALKKRLKALEKELSELRMRMVTGDASSATEVAGIRLLVREVPPGPAGEFRNMADVLRGKLGSGAVVLASRDDERVSLITAVSEDLTARLPAGRLAGRIAALVGGKGGGRPDFAQAGGRRPESLPDALASVPRLVEELVAETETVGAEP